MKKELLAGALLLSLCLGAWLNTRHIDSLTAACLARLTQSQSAAEQGNTDGALSALAGARVLWEKEALYTGIFLNRRDLDSVRDAFFQLEQLLPAGRQGQIRAGYAQLRQCLRDLAVQEHLSVENLF